MFSYFDPTIRGVLVKRGEDVAHVEMKEAWQRLTPREDEKGVLTAEYIHTHIWVWDGTEEKAHRWHLMVRREVAAVLTPLSIGTN